MAITINVNLDEILAALKNDLDFTGNADKYIKVNATADGFEFAAVDTSGLVPYTGATTNVNLGEFGVNSGYLQFDLTPTNTPTSQGTAYWDDSAETVALIMNGTTQKVGEDTFYHVKNSTGVEIPKGTAVMFAGTDGASGKLLITPFLADGTYPSSYFMGITAEAIANGANGKVYHFGKMRGINTSVYNDGDILYASTTSAGGFQTTKPSAPNNVISVAAVVNAGNNGTLMIRPIIEDSPTLDAVTTAGNTTTNTISVARTSITATDTYKLSMYEGGGTREFHLGVGNAYGAGARLRYLSGPSSIIAEVILGNDLAFDKKGSGGTIFRDKAVEKARFAGSTGNLLLGTTTDAGYKLNVNGNGRFLATNTSIIPLTVTAAAGQTANLLEINSSSGSGGDLFRVEDDGRVYLKEIRTVASSAFIAGGSLILGASGVNSYIATQSYFYPNSAGNAATLGVVDNLGRHWGALYAVSKIHIVDGVASSTSGDASAKLQVDSTTQGFLPPRMTGAQVEAISSPAEGLIAYATSAGTGDVTAAGWWGYNGSNWVSL